MTLLASSFFNISGAANGNTAGISHQVGVTTMMRLCQAIAAAFCIAISPAQAAGLKYLHISEGKDGPAIDAGHMVALRQSA